MGIKAEAIVEALYSIDAKAEIVDGGLVVMAPTGFLPGRASGEIYISLRAYERRTANGFAIPDNVGFIVNLPNRRSFSPDAAFYTGQPMGGKFLEGAPIFAVEVRSEGDYGEAEEAKMKVKRQDYFSSGTSVVWDVDVLRDELIRVYRSSDPEIPKIYRRGQIAEAEPAVPGWRMVVNELFTLPR